MCLCLHFVFRRDGARSKSVCIVFGRCHYLELHVFQFAFCLERAVSWVVCCCCKPFQRYCHIYSTLNLLSQCSSLKPQHLAFTSCVFPLLSCKKALLILLLFGVFKLIEFECVSSSRWDTVDVLCVNINCVYLWPIESPIIYIMLRNTGIQWVQLRQSLLLLVVGFYYTYFIRCK